MHNPGQEILNNVLYRGSVGNAGLPEGSNDSASLNVIVSGHSVDYLTVFGHTNIGLGYANQAYKDGLV